MPLHHIVLVKFKETTTSEQKQFWKDGAIGLEAAIPEVKGLIVGKKVPTHLDGGFDDGFIVVFDNFAGLEAYRPHPAHLAVKESTGSFFDNVLLFDIES